MLTPAQAKMFVFMDLGAVEGQSGDTFTYNEGEHEILTQVCLHLVNDAPMNLNDQDLFFAENFLFHTISREAFKNAIENIQDDRNKVQAICQLIDTQIRKVAGKEHRFHDYYVNSYRQLIHENGITEAQKIFFCNTLVPLARQGADIGGETHSWLVFSAACVKHNIPIVLVQAPKGNAAVIKLFEDAQKLVSDGPAIKTSAAMKKSCEDFNVKITELKDSIVADHQAGKMNISKVNTLTAEVTSLATKVADGSIKENDVAVFLKNTRALITTPRSTVAWKSLMLAALGIALGVAIGFAVGGPVGALIGGIVGGFTFGGSTAAGLTLWPSKNPAIENLAKAGEEVFTVASKATP